MASLENWPQLQALCLPGQEQPQCGHQQITIFCQNVIGYLQTCITFPM